MPKIDTIDHTFIIPLYNEETNIIPTIEVIETAVSKSLSYQIIIIDDCSQDQSYLVTKDFAEQRTHIELVKNDRNLGFAKTYEKGIHLAKGKTCQYIPSDNVISASDLKKLLENRIEEGAVIQYCLNLNSRALHRRIISNFFTFSLNRLLRLKLKYYNGLNIYPTSFLLAQDFDEDSFAFQAELTAEAWRSLRTKEVGTTCTFKDKTSSAFNIKEIKKVLRYLLLKAF